MVAIPFNNQTGQSKFQGSFHLDSTDYNYTIYLLPLTYKKNVKTKITNEIASYFGNRMFKGKRCLDIGEGDIQNYIKGQDISAFIIVNPVGIDNVASGTLQVYNWCIPSSSDINDDDVWINDVCRVSTGANDGNPLKGLFFIMEQLVVQNLQKTNIKLYIENKPDKPDNARVLKPKYESLGFIKNNLDNPDICPDLKTDDGYIVMEKTGLVPEPSVIDFSFLEQVPIATITPTINRKRKLGGTIRKHKRINKKCYHKTKKHHHNKR